MTRTAASSATRLSGMEIPLPWQSRQSRAPSASPRRARLNPDGSPRRARLMPGGFPLRGTLAVALLDVIPQAPGALDRRRDILRQQAALADHGLGGPAHALQIVLTARIALF